MRRIALTLAIALSLSLVAAPAGGLEGPCRGLDVPATIRCAADRWPVPGGKRKALDVAWCESRYNPKATNGRFKGVFQIGYDTEWDLWLSRYPVMAREWVRGILHGRSNVLVAVRTVHRIGSWKPWSCA